LGGANHLLSGWVWRRASKERKKKTLNLSLPILVMEGGNLKKGHTTQNIGAKLCGLLLCLRIWLQEKNKKCIVHTTKKPNATTLSRLLGRMAPK